MKPRTILSLAGTLAIFAGTTSVAVAEDSAPEAANRLDAVAARMVRGESYDQATRATLSGSTSNVRQDVYAARLSRLDSYDQAGNAARFATSEEADSANARHEKHVTAMNRLGAHEAGWTASLAH